MEPSAQRPVSRSLQTRRWGFGLRLHHLLFIAFTLVAGVPIVVLALWESTTSFQNELNSVRERHLLVARNLTSTLSRYVQDVKAVVTLTFESGTLATPVPGLTDLLTSLEVVDVCILAPDGSVESRIQGLPGTIAQPLDPKLLASLKALPTAGRSALAISNLYHDADDHPIFYLVKPLPNGRIGVGVLSTAYLVSLQQTIAFGDRGHAVIVDRRGRVIAHPLQDWVATSKDISATSVVAAMMRGESGVGQFYSPYDGNLIAGYAVVPETGWGVMVPQPIEELHRRADQVNEMATIIAVASFASAALMSWLIALYLARPVRMVAATAEAVLDGNDEVAVPDFARWVPREIRRLGQAFNTMLEDQRRRTSETTQALRQAETSNQAKTQFLANMSHEIRTPLNGVVGMIELLQLTDLSAPQRRYLEQATQSAQALLRLIDDILDLSKIEVGKLRLERAPFHLPSLVHDARMLFSDQARAKGLSMAVSLPDELNVVVVGDGHRLLQILTNLVSNALKFTGEGRVTIAVSLADDLDSKVRDSEVRDSRARDSEVRLRFAVTDTGIGIPLSMQTTIFDAFSQADTSTTRRYGGTGLGLSIARQLCGMMRGEIGVESAVGKGSTFWFTVVLDKPQDGIALPASIQHPAPHHSAPAEHQPSEPANAGFVSAVGRDFQAALRRAGKHSIRILMVEDNPANMRVTQALLETLGCEVIAARNGLEAVSAYRDGRFDLVLMDCQMPEMDGYEATRAIRQIEAFQGRMTPIVALTAHALEGSREASLNAGMNDQLTKPLTMSALTGKLLEWLTADQPRVMAIHGGGQG